MKGCADPPAVTQPAASHPLSGPGGLGSITGHHLKACPLGPLEGWARPRPCSGGDPCPEPRCLLIRRGQATSLWGQLSEGSDLALPGSRQPGRSAACRSRCSPGDSVPGGTCGRGGRCFRCHSRGRCWGPQLLAAGHGTALRSRARPVPAAPVPGLTRPPRPQEAMLDHALRTISYIADIGSIVVLMARRRMPRAASQDCIETTPGAPDGRKQYKMVCHVFESEDVSRGQPAERRGPQGPGTPPGAVAHCPPRRSCVGPCALRDGDGQPPGQPLGAVARPAERSPSAASLPSRPCPARPSSGCTCVCRGARVCC